MCVCVVVISNIGKEQMGVREREAERERATARREQEGKAQNWWRLQKRQDGGKRLGLALGRATDRSNEQEPPIEPSSHPVPQLPKWAFSLTFLLYHLINPNSKAPRTTHRQLHTTEEVACGRFALRPGSDVAAHRQQNAQCRMQNTNKQRAWLT